MKLLGFQFEVRCRTLFFCGCWQMSIRLHQLESHNLFLMFLLNLFNKQNHHWDSLNSSRNLNLRQTSIYCLKTPVIRWAKNITVDWHLRVVRGSSPCGIGSTTWGTAIADSVHHVRFRCAQLDCLLATDCNVGKKRMEVKLKFEGKINQLESISFLCSKSLSILHHWKKKLP